MNAEGLRILLVAAATSTAGGGEKHVADLLQELVGAGVNVGLVAPPGGDLARVAAGLGVRIYCAPIAAGFSWTKVRAVRRAIADFEPDVVHAHGSRAALFARLGDGRAAQRVVYTVHGIHVDKAGSSVRQAVLLNAERLLRHRTAQFVTVALSDAAKGGGLGLLDAERTRTIYNGIRLPLPAGSPGAFRAEIGVGGDVPLVVCVGRFHKQKDHATLLEAFALAREQVPSAVLALVGSGGDEGRLRERATSLRLSGAVRFVASRQGLAEVYADADVIALSSLWEGLPYVVLEAMAYGRPVASTNVDGIPEAVDDGVTGVLVPPSDPGALASAISGLLGDPARARAMGEAGRAKVEREFTLERMTREYLELYAELAGKATAHQR